MSQEQIPVCGVVPFPEVLLKNANTFQDCTGSFVFGVVISDIQSYLLQQRCCVSNIVKEIFGPQGKNGSCLNVKKDAMKAGLKVSKVKISSLGFKCPTTREEIIQRANQYDLVPMDTPRSWAIPLRGWCKEKEKITLFGLVHHSDILKKVPQDLMFTLGYSEEHGKYLSVRKASKDMLFQPDETIVLEGKH